jgi:hypothetical protein
MKRPTKKEVETFLKTEFPHIEFDGVKFEEVREGQCWFKIYSFGRLIGQADYPLREDFWENVKNHLKWAFK